MILETVLATIRRSAMFEPGDRVLVAVSGGPDSVALLHILLDLGAVLPLSLTVGHLDHGLRDAESKKDRAFVERLCRNLELECVSGREEVAALARRERRSIEEAGRVARRRFLRRLAGEKMCRRVAFGHQRDDQAESVLLRLVAGAGRGGLSGIKPVSEGLFVRPLLDCGRAEILRYLEERGIVFRVDATNADRRFPRNRIRHVVLPLLAQEFNPRVVEAIARTADLLREEDAFLERAARGLLHSLVLPPGLPSAGGARRDGGETPGPEERRPPAAAGASRIRKPAAASEEPVQEAEKVLLVDGAGAGRQAPQVSEPAAVSGAEPPFRTGPPLVLDAKSLARLSPAIGRRVMRLALRHAGLRGRDLAKARIDEALQLAGRDETNVSLSLGESLVARLEYGRLILDRGHGHHAGQVPAHPEAGIPTEGDRPGTGTDREMSVPAVRPGGSESFTEPAAPIASFPVPGHAVVPDLGVALSSRVVPVESVVGEYGRAPSNRAYLDADLLEAPLLIRRPRAGDRFRPLGAPGTRKLSDLWTDLRLPHEERQRCLLVESAGRIAWAVGLRTGHPFRVTDKTRRVAVLESSPMEEIPHAVRHATPPSGEEHPSESRRTLADQAITERPVSQVSSEHSVDQVSPERPILYTAEQIAQAVDRMAREVSDWAAGRELVLLGVLHGSFIFLSDLLRRLPGPVRVGFLDREGGLVSGGLALAGSRVLVVEDILDTGESLVRVLARVQEHAPEEIRTCVLFDKVQAVRTVPLEPDFRGLQVPDLWVVGYGLDQDGRERNLPYLTYV